MSQGEPKIEWPAMTKFVSQLNHDLRNHLNAVELQSAFLSELAPNDEMKQEIIRLREMTGQLGTHLQKLSDSLKRARPQMMHYLAREFVEDLRARLTREQPEESNTIEWRESLGTEAIEMDPQLLLEAFGEIFANAAAYGRGEGPLVFEAHGPDGSVDFILREPKKKFEGTTENWGLRPFARIRSGHYGLGLFRARGIFEQHHGSLRAEFDPAQSVLSTTVSLPRLAA